jgi:transcription antitermination factor NusA-like protein
MPHVKTELSDFASRLITIRIDPQKIRDVIGKGDAAIRALTEEIGRQIDITDHVRAALIAQLSLIFRCSWLRCSSNVKCVWPRYNQFLHKVLRLLY